MKANVNCMKYLEIQAEINGDRTALIFEDNKMSYKMLHVLSNNLAHRIEQAGLKPNSAIGIIMEPSFEMIVAICAVLKAGCFYIPIDTKYPKEFIEDICCSGNIKLLLLDAIRDYSFIENTYIVNISELQNCENDNYILCEDIDIAYVGFTSGSNGKSKGIMVTHENLLTYVNAFLNEFHINKSDVVLQQAIYTFDTFIEEVFPTIFSGASLVICKRADLLSIRRLLNIIEINKVSIVSTTPALLNEINKYNVSKSVKLFISGGDVLLYSNIDNLIECTDIYNTYGPSETTVCATYYKCKKNDLYKLPIGTPILGYNVYLLDENNNMVSEGQTGEIYISGKAVSKGYINNPQLTSELFLNDPFYPGNKMYRTGDIGKLAKYNVIEFIGRRDNQIKINGYRIELEYIEAIINRHSRINGAVVRVDRKQDGEKRLVCFYEANEEISDIMEYLKNMMPKYMIPDRFIRIGKIPFLSNGKIDRKGIQEIIIENKNMSIDKSTISIIRETIKNILEDDMQFDDSSSPDDLKIDSLAFIKLIVDLEMTFNIEFDENTLERLGTLTINELEEQIRIMKGENLDE